MERGWEGSPSRKILFIPKHHPWKGTSLRLVACGW
jgi:hypothetical protein